LFGEIVHIIAQAQAYQKDLIPDDDSMNPYSKDTTDEQHEWLEKKRKQVHDFSIGLLADVSHSHECNYEAYIVIDRLMPGLTNTLAQLSRSQKADYFTLVSASSPRLHTLTQKQVQKGANDACSDDFRRVTWCIAQWINEDSSSDKPDLKVFDHTPPITRTNEESHDFGETPPGLGGMWDAVDHSCAYDAVFTVLYNIWTALIYFKYSGGPINLYIY
jgi:hypothetical protein